MRTRGSGPREDQRVRSWRGPEGQVLERTPRGTGPGEDHQRVRSWRGPEGQVLERTPRGSGPGEDQRVRPFLEAPI